MTAPAVSVAVILAGGQGRRMGGINKALVPLAGRPLVVHVIDRLKPQAGIVAINANRDLADFDRLNCPIVPDGVATAAGPLDGMLGALDFAGSHGAASVLVAPADCPFLPHDLAERLAHADPGDGTLVLAASEGRVHPVIGLWPVSAIATIRKHLADGGKGAVMAVADEIGVRTVAFERGSDAPDPFFNINTPADLAVAERLLAGT